MSDRSKDFWFALAFVVGVCATASGLIWLWEKHPGIIFAVIFIFALLYAGVLFFAAIRCPPRPRSSAEDTRDAALAGFIVGLLTGHFMDHEKRDEQRPPEA